ncbi:MAG: hypothetical protein MJA83_09900, partial [Gammaproteobacteria bacterium]|nr:hypothetical protein [Gammaproteobacteria bacterium]
LKALTIDMQLSVLKEISSDICLTLNQKGSSNAGNTSYARELWRRRNSKAAAKRCLVCLRIVNFRLCMVAGVSCRPPIWRRRPTELMIFLLSSHMTIAPVVPSTSTTRFAVS